jgi:hypothetical protein
MYDLRDYKTLSARQIIAAIGQLNHNTAPNRITHLGLRARQPELLSNLVYAVGQAALLSDSSSTCTPSLNFTLFTTSFSSANPLSRFHFFCATSSNL